MRSVIQVFPGAPSCTSLRALILSDEPIMSGSAVPGVGASVPLTLTQLPLGPFPTHMLPIGFRVTRADSARPLTPATRYRLEVLGKTNSGTAISRTLPNGLPLTVAVGSCFYYGFGGAARYLRTLRSAHAFFGEPALKLLIGDNLYLDVAKTSRNYNGGWQETAAHYLRHWWRHGPYRDVLQTLPTLTTYDDHEFWNNYPEWQPHLARSHRGNHAAYDLAAQEGIRLFQDPLNPDPIAVGRSYVFGVPGLTFFVADTRTQRTRASNNAPRFMTQLEFNALENWTRALTSPGVLVLGQPLWLGSGSWMDYNLTDFQPQYARLWRALSQAPYDVLVVSGDVHHSRWIQIGLPGQRSIYEFVSSPVCHIPTTASIALGSYGAQGQGKVAVEGQVPVSRGVDGRYSRYLFGTSVPNTLSLLNFTQGPQGSVFVGGAFLDTSTGRAARAEAIEIDDGWFRTRTSASSLTTSGLCLRRSAIRLRRR